MGHRSLGKVVQGNQAARYLPSWTCGHEERPGPGNRPPPLNTPASFSLQQRKAQSTWGPIPLISGLAPEHPPSQPSVLRADWLLASGLLRKQVKGPVL